MDLGSEQYAQNVATVVKEVLGSKVIGVYLHGSATYGGFDARRSDVDVLAVVGESITPEDRATLADRLLEGRLSCPAAGIEFSIVTFAVAQNPIARPSFELHMTTAPQDSKVVDGSEIDGDPDLVLHFAVCRQSGRLLGSGRSASETFAAVDERLVVAQLVNELRWAAENVPNEYAALNACRAWKFAVDGTLVSKIDGGKWALHQVLESDQELVKRAIDRQQCLDVAELHTDDVVRFVDLVLHKVTQKV